jgi:hypothetical protein
VTTLATAPGTAIALHATARPVVHNIQLRGLRRRRIAVTCSCQPGVPLGVQGLNAWTGRAVLDVQAEHEAAFSHRQEQAAGYTRSVLDRPEAVKA